MREQGEVTPVGRIVSETIDYNNRYFPVIRRVVETPDFETREPQYLLDRSGKTFAASVVLTESGNMLFVREPKYGQMDYFLVVPTGAVEDGETAEQAARRETLEETGFQAENFTVINSRVVSLADKIDGGAHLILIADKAKKVQEPEKYREVIELTKEQVEQLLDNELTNLQLEVDISRLAIFEALRFFSKKFVQDTTGEARKNESLTSLANEMRTTIQSLSRDTKASDITLKKNAEWKKFVRTNKQRHLLALAFNALYRVQTKLQERSDYQEITLDEIIVPEYEDLLKERFIGKKTASLIKLAFPNNSMFDSEDQTQ